MPKNILESFGNLYDKVKGDNDDFPDEDTFLRKVEELEEVGYIRSNTAGDIILYSSKEDLEWHDFVDIDDPIKKNVLLLLVDNPRTFFVFLNTQKGKMRINALETKKWKDDETKRVVSFIVVDNDKTLADQSAEGIKKTIGELDVKLFMLSTNSTTTLETIKMYIDAYELNKEYLMPVIVLLANNNQIIKMLKLIQRIDNKIKERNSLLRYGIIWDEADKIYPQFRNKVFQIDGEELSITKYIIYNNIGLYRLGFTTASEGELLDEEYPECANSHLYPVVISPEDQEHYRALHHPEAVTHKVPFTAKHNNNSYAKEIILKNKEHFMTPITLKSGEIYHKKIIVNSNVRMNDMKEFANWSNEQNMNALVFNGFSGASVKVYKVGCGVRTFKTKGKKFNEVIFYIYKKLHLNDKPLVIIGRRKVDRGLGFHYCPRDDSEIQIDINQPEGILITQNREGLIWTDMILGKIEDKNVATQKAGRLAGIIGNSPQYSGSIDYWTDEHTEDKIRRHNTIVDVANTYSGCSALQAVKHAEDNTPKQTIPSVTTRVNTNKRVPVIIGGLNDTDIIFTTKKNKEKKDFILSKINNEEHKKLYDFINTENVDCTQITQPVSESSYKKHITDVVNASIANTPFSIDVKKENKDKNNWQVFIDNREKRLCFVIWSIDKNLY